MRNRSVVSEARQIELAAELVNLGARLQVLESETTLSRERLIRLYKELKSVSPPKGMLPFSVDWFVSWQPNIHSSLFAGIHRYLVAHAGVAGIHATVKAYRLYLEHIAVHDLEPVLTFTRAWTLLRYLDSSLLARHGCQRCNGLFIVNALDLHEHYLCGLCAPPSRAGRRLCAPAVPA